MRVEPRVDHPILPGVEIESFEIPKPRRMLTADGWNPTLKYHLVQDTSALGTMIDTLRRADADGICWDTETSGLKPELGARIVGHCFAARTGEKEISGWYVPMRHIGEHNRQTQQLDPQMVTERLKPVFAAGGEVMTYHAKFDMKMARADGLWLQRPVSDIAIEATAFNENENRFGLKFLADKYCTPGAKAEEKAMNDWMRKDASRLGLIFKKYSKKQRKKLREKGLDELSAPTYLQRFGYARTPVNLCATYGIHDVFYNWWLSKSKYRHIRTQFPDLWQREHQVMHMLCDMEWWGQRVDAPCIRDTHERTKAAVEYWLKECQRLLPGHIDHTFEASDTELRDLYFVTLGMQPQKHTKKDNKPSVDKESRLLLTEKYPQHALVLKAIGHLATVMKLHSTYAGAYLRFYSPETRSIHSCYNQLEQRSTDGGAPVTGRLSSSDPNGQNVAKKKIHLWNCGCTGCIRTKAIDLAKEWWDWDEGATKHLLKNDPKGAREILTAARVGRLDRENTVSIHRYFAVPEGHVRAYIDFSQIELRILAWFCQDPVMLAAYAEGRDLHQAIADELGITRDIAKQVNFGNSYGMTEYGLALRLPGYYADPLGTIERAKMILDAYFKRFPRILAFRREFARMMRMNSNSFINPFGRPRRIPNISAQGEDKWKRRRAERRMMSSIISGTSADLMKESMIRTNPIARAVGGKMVGTIHDELIFDLLKKPGWARTILNIVDRMEDWPMFNQDRPNIGTMMPGRRGVPIKVSVELSETNWEEKREIKISHGQFSWAE